MVDIKKQTSLLHLQCKTVVFHCEWKGTSRFIDKKAKLFFNWQSIALRFQANLSQQDDFILPHWGGAQMRMLSGHFLPFKVPFQDSDSGHRNLLLSSVVMTIQV